MADLIFWLELIAPLGLLLTGAVLTLTVDWRVSFAALAVQYLFVAAMLSPVVGVPVAAVKALALVISVTIGAFRRLLRSISAFVRSATAFCASE